MFSYYLFEISSMAFFLKKKAPTRIGVCEWVEAQEPELTEAITLGKSIYIFRAICLSQQASLIIFIQSVLSELSPLPTAHTTLRTGTSNARLFLCMVQDLLFEQVYHCLSLTNKSDKVKVTK